MTESTNPGPDGALFDRIRQLVERHGVDIRQHQVSNSLRLDFADGQRILINLDPQTRTIWLAARSGGAEFAFHGGGWRSHELGDFFVRLDELITQTIASNPLNARAPVAVPVPPAAQSAPVVYYEEAEPRHGLRNVLILTLAGLLGFWAAQKLHPTQGMAEPPVLPLADDSQACEATFPGNGSITLFPGNSLRTDGPNDPEVTLKNDHSHPLLFILAAPHTAIPSLSVLVHARQSVNLHLPAGQYDMIFAVGNKWCNARQGFSDGQLLKFDKSLTVEMDKPIRLSAQTSGAGVADFQLFVKTEVPEAALPPPTFSGDGSMEVQRQPNGHFYLPGTLEGVPLTFMVDTGASVTSINSEMARQAGIRNCKEMQFQTANGTTNGCIALVSRMTLGNFVLENITVAVMPNMEVNLLGANVLRHFQVSQGDTSMQIGRRQER
jgi:clan AA aspartic protease (TIGR02281 family)